MAFDQEQHPRGGNPANRGEFSEAQQSRAEIRLEAGNWPAHDYETRPWSSSGRPAKREDRMVTSITVSLPPLINDLDFAPPRDLVPLLDSAKSAIIELDRAHGSQLGTLGGLLIRTESVASSQIEDINATSDDFARATAGVSSNESATSMVLAAKALENMIASAGTSGNITLESILEAHGTLMAGDRIDGRYAGTLRTMQNWISGNDESPLNAIHIPPPPPETVREYMGDLVLFANRDDMDAIVQAAIVHAQFESIHPFTDGNGRIGRALIGAVLRRRELTTVTVVPLASALLAQRQRYFDQVNAYRDGEVIPFVRNVAVSARIASQEASESAANLRNIPTLWAEISKPRANSAAASLLTNLMEHPIVSVADAMQLTGASETSTFDAMNRLEADGVVHEVTGRKRDRVWVATEVLAELDRLGARIEKAIRLAG